MELHVYDKENKILKPFFTQRRPSKKTCSTNSGEIKAIQQSLIKKIIKKEVPSTTSKKDLQTVIHNC